MFRLPLELLSRSGNQGPLRLCTDCLEVEVSITVISFRGLPFLTLEPLDSSGVFK